MTDWTIQDEQLLEKLHCEMMTIASYNRQKIKIYSKVSSRFNIPIIVLSSANSFFSLGLTEYLPQSTISILNSIISLLVGILSSVYLYIGVNSKMNNATLVNHEINELTTKIFKELMICRENRTSVGKEFINECFMEYSKIMQRQSIIKRHIQHHLIFEGEDNISITIEPQSTQKSKKVKPAHTQEKIDNDSLSSDDMPKPCIVD